MRDIVFKIARILLQKQIAFCIYRFPKEETLRLAIANGILSPKTKKLWIAPFLNTSKAEPVFLEVLNTEELNETVVNTLIALPPKEYASKVRLPKETTKTEYFTSIEAFLNDIHSGKLDKAILSRVILQSKPENFDVLACFEQICIAYPDTFSHLSLLPNSEIWMGATPELLLNKEGNTIRTMTLAGTQARRDDNNYSWGKKELEEHAMTGLHIEKNISKYNGEIVSKNETPYTVTSGKVAHLRTDYIFNTPTNFDLTAFINALHPTPAVGGLPVANGLQCIKEHEGYDRAYYCGIIGETDFATTAKLFVNLRCMQIGESNIAIYVGGGITSASVPEDEWQETILKSKTMTEIIQPKIPNSILQ
ncbi:MAG TPA: chorismate-binding protein [Chitinophagales bacterium]|nr:chorismate-binding protein [Chitinophagales bacterium]HNM33166.1 chorismate-binding protein [Chitinophagales bacterium]